MKSQALVILLFWIISSSIHAQNGYNQYYEFDNIQSKELIKGISKDERGFVWVATDEGVLRYDGNETLLFFKELPNPYTKEFLLTRDGRFFILHDSGLAEVINENDSIYIAPFKMKDFVLRESLIYPKSIYEDRQGNIWIGEINSIVRINENGLKRFNMGQEYQSISYHHTFSFEEDVFGNLWIAPFKGGLLKYNRSSDSIEIVNIKDYPITEVSSVKNVRGDYLLVSGREGLLQLKIDSDKNILETRFYDQVKNISVLEVIGDQVFIGTWESGLYHAVFNPRLLNIEKLDNVSIIDVIDFYYDPADDELWITGSENIGLLKNSAIEQIEAAGSNRIESVTVDDKDGYYYSIGQQVFYLEPSLKEKAREVFYLDDSYFSKIYYDDGKLWVGDAFGTVFYYNLNNRQRTNIVSRTNVSINQIFEDSGGNKWFTGNTNGLIRVDTKNHPEFYHALDTTWAMIESPEGKLYCGSNSLDSMLHVYNKETDSFELLKLEFKFEPGGRFLLNDLQIDNEENIWLASSFGLLKIPGDSGNYRIIERFKVPEYEVDEPVRAVAFSGDKMWLANNYGLVLVKDGNSVLFNKDGGLPSKIIKDGGLKPLGDGKLLILTAKGLAFVDEGGIQIKKSRSPIFKSIRVNSELFKPGLSPENTLPYHSKIEAEFISLAFPGKTLEYQTRILGMGDEWSKPSSNRNLSVLSFAEGSYSLQVRARESGSVWSAPLTFSFVINSPWFKSWWAIIGFILVSVIIVYASVTIHNRNLIAQKRKLRKIIEARTAEINRQKNEIIDQQEKIIKQKEELLEKNQAILKSQQALHDADMNYLHLKEKQLEEQIEYKNKQITTHTLNIIQKNETLQDLKEQLEGLIKKSDTKTAPELRRTLKVIDESFKLDKDWEDFKLYFEQIYTGFYAKLKVNYHDITTSELRHCALIRLNLTIQECASILGISPDSVKVSRTRLRKKLNLLPNQSLSDFIMSL